MVRQEGVVYANNQTSLRSRLGHGQSEANVGRHLLPLSHRIAQRRQQRAAHGIADENAGNALHRSVEPDEERLSEVRGPIEIFQQYNDGAILQQENLNRPRDQVFRGIMLRPVDWMAPSSPTRTIQSPSAERDRRRNRSSRIEQRRLMSREEEAIDREISIAASAYFHELEREHELREEIHQIEQRMSPVEDE